MMAEGQGKGVTDKQALAMDIEIRHCAGEGGANRMLGRMSKPYTADGFYNVATTM